MNRNDFRKWTHKASDWSADYYESLSERPVRSPVRPGEIGAMIAPHPPELPHDMADIFADFERIVPAGMTHWQHPRFFAYFQSNAAPAAVVAEQLAGAMAAQCMLWQTSPAATELEIKMVDWLRQACGLSDQFEGVLQDTASTATLCAVLTMRERALGWQGNRQGLAGGAPVRVYASNQAHSSIDKAAWIAGIGQENLVKIPTDERFAMDTAALRQAIRQDRTAGMAPAGIIGCIGGTSIGAMDDLEAVCEVARDEDLFCHVDAAWAGSAMICPEFRHLWAGIEGADSIVINPHKWLGAPMECSAHFVRDPETLKRTLAIQPEYLKTRDRDGVVNFSEWSVQLGCRFRALKVWFLLRAYGLEGLRERVRNHVQWSQDLCSRLAAEPDFEITTQPSLSLFSFRFTPKPGDRNLDELNLALVSAINDDGRIYLTQTVHEGNVVIRFVAGQFESREEDLEVAFEAICETARELVT